LNAGGVIDSGWWYDRTNIYDPTDQNPNRLAIFKRYYDFVKDIDLSNGRYIDSGATTSSVELRVRGQKDATQGRAHLWIDNKSHTWKAVVDGLSVAPRSSTVTVPGLPAGTYRVTWYDTYQGADGLTQQISTDSAGTLALDLQLPLATDIAVRVERVTGSVTPTQTPTLTPTSVPPTSTPTAAVTATSGLVSPTPTSTPPSRPCGNQGDAAPLTVQEGTDGALTASIRARTGNVVSIQLGAVRNANVQIGAGTYIASGSNVVMQPASSRIELRANRISRPGEVFVPLVIRDGCGEWSTFFGSGS